MKSQKEDLHRQIEGLIASKQPGRGSKVTSSGDLAENSQTHVNPALGRLRHLILVSIAIGTKAAVSNFLFIGSDAMHA